MSLENLGQDLVHVAQVTLGMAWQTGWSLVLGVDRRDILTPLRRSRPGLAHMWNGPTGKVLFGGLIQCGAVQSYVRPFGAGM